MANSSLQIIGLIICIIAGICTCLAVVMPEWRRNDPSGDVIEAVVRHQGLWTRCISYTTGLWQCDDYDAFFLGLPTQLQAARGLAIMAIVFGIFATLLSVIGMECTKCVESSARLKCRVAMVAAILWILSAFSIGIAVSYYGHQVVQEYSIVLFADDRGQRYVFGTSLFLGWAAMGVGFLGGAVMVCGSFYVEAEDDEYWNRGKVGHGLRRMRESFRESYRAVRPTPREKPRSDYV